MMIDLHCHSSFSDGLLCPQALLDCAIQNKVRVLALTDHDTIAGLASLRDAAQGQDITLVDGIELSASWRQHDVHILGLGIRPEDAGLSELLLCQQKQRSDRAQQIGQKLELLGVQNAYAKARIVAGHDRVARPHFAHVLIQEGLVKDVAGAFKQYLKRGCPAYIKSAWLSLSDIVKGIVNAGGDAVIAHPLKYKLTRTKLCELIEAFKDAGGIGMEVVSGDMPRERVRELAILCERYDLYASTGSDFHGPGYTRVTLGRQMPLPVNCKPIWQKWNFLL